jgi:hypothetical protein
MLQTNFGRFRARGVCVGHALFNAPILTAESIVPGSVTLEFEHVGLKKKKNIKDKPEM